MIVKNARMLKVSTPEGHRIIINTVRTSGDRVTIASEYIKLVEQDNPPFSKKGYIIMTCLRKDYQATIQKLTSYLENLFLKGLSNESIHSSVGTGNDSRRDKSKTVKRTVGIDLGKGSDSSVYPGSRREEPTKSSGRGKSSSEVDKVSNKDSSPQDKARD